MSFLQILSNVLRVSYEPYFFIGIFGFLFCLYRKIEPEKRRLIFFLLAAVLFMIVTRSLLGFVTIRYVLSSAIIFLIGVGTCGMARWFPAGYQTRVTVILVVLVLIIGFCRVWWRAESGYKNFDDLQIFQKEAARKWERPAFVACNSEANRYAFYFGMPVISAAGDQNLRNELEYLNWSSDAVYLLTGLNFSEKQLSGYSGQFDVSCVLEDMASKSKVYLLRNKKWPPASLIQPAGASGRGTPVMNEDFENPRIVPLQKSPTFSAFEQRGMEIPQIHGMVNEPQEIMIHGGYGFMHLRGSSVRVLEKGEPEVIEGNHSLLVQLVSGYGGLFGKWLPCDQSYRGRLLFRGTPGSRFEIRMEYQRAADHPTGLPGTTLVRAACARENAVYQLEWTMPATDSKAVRAVSPVIVCQQGRLIFDDIQIWPITGKD